MSGLDAPTLLRAYAIGVFPMAMSRDDPELYWFDPEMRGVIPLDAFHVPHRLKRTIRQRPYRISVDTAFEHVMRACAEPRPGHEETWINDEIVDLYTELFEHGHAHSIECFEGSTLVGGLYGVSLGAAFFGESMFSRRRDASKVALWALVEVLRTGGYQLLDTQYLTPHLSQFGAVEIPRDDYKERLATALKHDAVFHSRALPSSFTSSSIEGLSLAASSTLGST